MRAISVHDMRTGISYRPSVRRVTDMRTGEKNAHHIIPHAMSVLLQRTLSLGDHTMRATWRERREAV